VWLSFCLLTIVGFFQTEKQKNKPDGKQEEHPFFATEEQ
jgi:hypothetical protein